jgi:hypothetical protein
VQLHTEAQINFGDLTPYLTYVSNILVLNLPRTIVKIYAHKYETY